MAIKIPAQLSAAQYRVAVLYGPAALEPLAAGVGAAFSARTYAVTVASVADSEVSLISGADLVVFCTSGATGAPIHEDFAEACRALQGMNLAGRFAAVVAVGSAATARELKKVLRDSEITMSATPCILDSADAVRDARVWAKSLVTEFQQVRKAWAF